MPKMIKPNFPLFAEVKEQNGPICLKFMRLKIVNYVQQTIQVGIWGISRLAVQQPPIFSTCDLAKGHAFKKMRTVSSNSRGFSACSQ